VEQPHRKAHALEQRILRPEGDLLVGVEVDLLQQVGVAHRRWRKGLQRHFARGGDKAVEAEGHRPRKGDTLQHLGAHIGCR
jgi:hypothetical protein